MQVDSVKAFHNMVVDDMLADVLRIACFVAVSLMLFYSRRYLVARGLFSGETFVLTLFALLGMQVMVSAQQLLTLYLGLELLSLSLYSLVAMQRTHTARGRGGDEVLRARRAGVRNVALRAVDDLRRHRITRHRRRRAGGVGKPANRRS